MIYPLIQLTSYLHQQVTQILRCPTQSNIESIKESKIIMFFDEVPIDLAVQAARQKTGSDLSLPNRTAQTPSQITDPLNLVLRATYFQYNVSAYEQTGGAAVIADHYIKTFKDQAATHRPTNPGFGNNT